MIEIRKTKNLADWIDTLRDLRGRARIERLALGYPGDFKPIRESVYELRIDVGPGYRIYYTLRGQTLIILLVGGDKSTQVRDIKTALQLARNL